MSKEFSQTKDSAPAKPEPAGPGRPSHVAGRGEFEELSAADDAIIGRALRWSGAVFALLAVLAAGTVLFLNRKPAAPATHLTPITAPTLPERPVAEVPRARFTEVSRQAGIEFVHVNGAAGEKLLPETMGGGVAFVDYDGDQDQDLLFINGTYWPWDERAGRPPRPTPVLYQNDGQGHFQDVTPGSGLDLSFYGMGVAVGDYDRDGRDDLFVSAVGPNRLFHNLGQGRFEEVGQAAGVAGDSNEWSTSCAFTDVDNDGDLDLFVCNYVRWSKEIDFEVGWKIDGVTRAYGPPMNFEGTFPYLYRNEGTGRFTDISAESGVQIRNPSTGQPMAKSLGVAPVDLDSDGWIDLVVANDTVQNFVFHNQRNGTFREMGALSGIAFDSYGNTRGAMGIDSGCFRNDDALGIAIGNFANEMTALYVSQNQPLAFSDEAITEGIGPVSRLPLKFGVLFLDYDLDGRLDLLTANGHLEEEITKIQQSQSYRQPAQLFWNCGPQHGPSFVTVSTNQAGSDLFRPIVGRGSAFADWDGDGDLDLVLAQAGGPPLLLRNDQQLRHPWVRLVLRGRKSNPNAIGTRIRVHQPGQTLARQVMPTRSYLSQSEQPVTIGLGSAGGIDRLEILWPSGQKQTTDKVELNTTTILEEPL